MGMRAHYYRRSPAELARLEADPDAAVEELAQDSHSSKRSFFLDKEWHALNFLLTGDATLDLPPGRAPLEQVVRGARESSIEGSYGQLRVLEPADVKSVAAALAKLDVNELESRFDAKSFNRAKIYPHARPGGWSAEELEGLLMLYPRLQRFFKEAAADGEAVLTGIF